MNLPKHPITTIPNDAFAHNPYLHDVGVNAHSFIYWWRLRGAWTGCRVPYYHTSMRGGTPCFMFLLTRDLCLKFLLPGIHKQWTIPPCLLAELFLLYTPCLSESTHIANHLCTKPGRISAK